jgi:hypothetical protein
MDADTRQTLIGVTGLTIMAVVALLEDYNGAVTASYLVAVVALVSPQALDRINLSSGGQ